MTMTTEALARTRIEAWIATYEANSKWGDRTGVSYPNAPLNVSDLREVLDALANGESQHKLELAAVRVEAFTAESDTFRERIAARDAVIENQKRLLFKIHDDQFTSDEVEAAIEDVLAQSPTSTLDDVKVEVRREVLAEASQLRFLAVLRTLKMLDAKAGHEDPQIDEFGRIELGGYFSINYTDAFAIAEEAIIRARTTSTEGATP